MNTLRTFFEECYRDNYRHIYNYILSKTGNIHNSEDLCQEVFARFLEHMDKIHTSAVRNWLYSAAKNILHEHYRSSISSSTENIEDASVVSDESLSYNHPDYDMAIILEDIKRSLSPAELAIYEYTSIRCCTDRETAEALGITARQFRYRAGIIRRKVLHRLHEAGILGTLEMLFFFIYADFFCQLCLLNDILIKNSQF